MWLKAKDKRDRNTLHHITGDMNDNDLRRAKIFGNYSSFYFMNRLSLTPGVGGGGACPRAKGRKTPWTVGYQTIRKGKTNHEY